MSKELTFKFSFPPRSENYLEEYALNFPSKIIYQQGKGSLNCGKFIQRNTTQQ